MELTLIRHGQAQTGAKDEASYDQLSELGGRQADWLGLHLAQNEVVFDHIFSGNLHRQMDTAKRISNALGATFEVDPRLNEMDYFGLAASLKESHAVEFPSDRESFITHVPQVLDVWHKGQIHSELESFEDFETRISGMLEMAQNLEGRVLFVTSGGIIGAVMRQLMQLEMDAYAHLLMQVYNSSLHRFVKTGNRLALETFNSVAHLDHPDRLYAKTYT